MARRAQGGGSEVGIAKSSKEAIGGFAEDLGRLLGQARNKAEGWLGQRQAIVKQMPIEVQGHGCRPGAEYALHDLDISARAYSEGARAVPDGAGC